MVKGFRMQDQVTRIMDLSSILMAFTFGIQDQGFIHLD